MDCIKIFKFLISSSVTPPGSHFRHKSMQIFDTFQLMAGEESKNKLGSPNVEIYGSPTIKP